jgi:hypothetical protein
MKTFLMVKTHSVTGLKYLCITKKDPYKYNGSGLYWQKHLKEHGTSHTTEVLMECSSKDEVREWGLYYSHLWDVVRARDESGRKIWANLKPEEGDGAASGEFNHLNNPEIKQRHLDAVRSSENRARVSVETKKAMAKPEVVQKLSDQRNTPEYKARARKRLEETQAFGSQKGKENSRHDSSVRRFEHDSGIVEECTSYDLRMKYGLDQGNISKLINGKCKKIKGWKISDYIVIQNTVNTIDTVS